MSKIFSIAKYTFIGIFRNRILGILVLFGFLLLAASVLFGLLSQEQELRMLTDLGLAAIEILTFLSAVFLSVQSRAVSIGGHFRSHQQGIRAGTGLAVRDTEMGLARGDAWQDFLFHAGSSERRDHIGSRSRGCADAGSERKIEAMATKLEVETACLEKRKA